jgi:addiction module RelE/StbE family toxin
MLEVYEHTRVGRQLKRLPTEVLKRYEKWKDIVTMSGPQGLRMIKGFHDESLFGKWKGHRSSRLNNEFRVIYRVESDRIVIEVVSITAHDYRKKRS